MGARAISVVDLFNAIEALFWGGLAVYFLCRFHRAEAVKRRVARRAALWLMLFALSDAIEFHTGAWWRPWWLLLLKGSCLAGLLECGWRSLRFRAGSEAPRTADSSGPHRSQ